MAEAEMTVADVLSKARDVLAERGWCQGAFEKDGALCLFGALCVASGVKPNSERDEWDAPGARPFEFTLAVKRVLEVLVDEEYVGRWNDAPKRTYEDVILALKRAEELAVTS